MEKALITFDKRYIASAKVIANNGGKLDFTTVVDGILIQRYWMELISMYRKPPGATKATARPFLLDAKTVRWLRKPGPD